MCDKNDSPINANNCRSTPNRKVRNPFDKALIERLSLHKPICSPGMCKTYKKQGSGPFRWDIDQACTLAPADIVVCSSQFEPSPDPMLEKIAEEATEQFFSQEMVMPSPLLSSKKVEPLQVSTDSHMPSFKDSIVMRDVSAQTVLTLPPDLPPELGKLLQPYFTFTQDQDISGEYEITANGSLRRKLLFEEHSDMEHYDSEQTDDEIHVEPRPPSSYDTHEPVVFSPDLSRDLVTRGMKRTFGTPLNKNTDKPYRNKILDLVESEPCFSPIEFQTPKRDAGCGTSSNSLASESISPVTKTTSSDEEKNNFTSPESEVMASCLDCVATQTESENQGPCICSKTGNKSLLKRSTSLKESPPRSRKSSFSFGEKRSLSMSSLHRSRSVQKLDFSMDMSVDGSFHENRHDSDPSSPKESPNASDTPEAAWLVEESSIHQLVKQESRKHEAQKAKNRKLECTDSVLDETPVKGKSKSSVLSHEISKIRVQGVTSPLSMSLDSSLDIDNPLGLEDKKIDFNNVDLKTLTENPIQFDFTSNATTTKFGSDSSTSFKRVDSGFNENTFYANASSYYESAIKPSELTVTDAFKSNTSKTALKELTNVPWMRVDSGFKDETSTDSTHFYPNESSIKKVSGFRFSEARVEDKENVEDFDRFLRSAGKDAMSMSDVFHEDMTFNCNFSSTPSKNKSRKVNS